MNNSYFSLHVTFLKKQKKLEFGRRVLGVMENHSTSDIQRATAIPSNKDINCITVFFKADVPLFISARTPARAMYIKPPAVNPCKFGTQTFVVTTTPDHHKHCSTAQLFITSIKDDCPGSLPHIKA